MLHAFWETCYKRLFHAVEYPSTAWNMPYHAEYKHTPLRKVHAEELIPAHERHQEQLNDQMSRPSTETCPQPSHLAK